MLMVHAAEIYAALDVNMHQELSSVPHNPFGEEETVCSLSSVRSHSNTMHWAIVPLTSVRPDCIVCHSSHLLDGFPRFYTLFAILHA